MLREAADCGIRLDASGVVLQPALSDVTTVKSSLIIPDELRTLLDQQSSGDTIEHDKDDEVQALIEEHLPHDVLLDLVPKAAAYDTGMVGDSAGGPISDDLRHLPLESLTPKWFPVEVMVLSQRSYSGTEEKDHDVWK